ncbi:MAG: hypothetical protein DSZ32_02525 [Gammaproteobacteria bacterium]|nr:MAG: hypothetical protein DSZ32_02525 [Gammaproteobacteria bacterium]
MTRYIRFLIQFVLFRAGPADAPAEPRFLWATASAAALTNFLLDNGHVDTQTRFLFSVMQVVLLGLLLHILLTFRKRAERWRQTAASLFGASAMINLASWPLIMAGASEDASRPSGPVAFVVIALTIWFLALMARTLHLALEIRPAFAFLITFLCLMITGVILLNLFPLPAPTETT